MIDEIKLIQLLKEKKISGEQLAQIYNVSRVAVWKKIKKLKDLGYKIGSDKHGYRIIQPPDKLLPQEIIPNLKTKFIGKKYLYFEEIDSTNIQAKRENYEDGTVIFAESQTAGKGRKNRKWHSHKGLGLYFTIVLKPDIEVNYLSHFGLLFNYSVFKVLRNYVNGEIKIKWPNDIYLNGKKIAGFLIESSLENNSISKLIVGVGINVNQSIKDFEEDIKEVATSLKIEEGKTFSRKEIFLEILQQIEKDYLKFIKEKYLDIKKIEENLLWLNQDVMILEDGKTILLGKLICLNEDGSLMLKTDEGLKFVYVGDLSIRNK
ncbi:biotin--[acetyl-CoA-carboxylase] ligase [Sulfurihydrogenibium sp.]|jgi:BirA family biotin operon repressor/biotin-[acetyl-CoA-carboxylase] ligase|uniref:biotin--[acetyl-CoA-carboxylase] ligase n=1 Tax=Sulfurihydrogenibium sp. TaxID=2053621 RepID=UPI0026089B4A|nr:biotin--[acetyl-CoA-carboxylase] ligase [Sulfurihydrogenibium sp.]